MMRAHARVRFVLAGALVAGATWGQAVRTPVPAPSPVVPADPSVPATPPAPLVAPVVAPAPPVARNESLGERLASTGENDRFAKALDAAGLGGTLAAMGPLTVFAPNDSAFSSTLYASYDDLLKPENRGKLAELLRYHVVAGLFDTSTLDARIAAAGDGIATLVTVQGKPLTVRNSAGEYLVTDATNHTAHLTRLDLYERNGVVHVVDQVLMPDTP
jgi:uncharacterized surface protein with fasciclin (FAS1) repeats